MDKKSATAFSLEGRVALITGSTAGIGRAMADVFSRAGATVVVNGRKSASVEKVTAEIPGSIPACFDASDTDAVESSLDQIIDTAGRLDIVVCNAAMRDRRTITQIDEEAFRRVLEANTISQYELARRAIERMAHPEVGRVIFFSSTAGQRPYRGDPAYAASKAGVESLARSFCFEFAKTGITANVIAPGFVLTEFNHEIAAQEEIQAFIRKRVPSGRWADPEEIANAALFLASDAGSYVNGHVLTVDAGLSAIM